jgi:2,4-dichlorophenol 6-monooxygenase
MALEFDTDVFIVGTGPSGATAALALATYGVRAHMITRYRWLSNTPRAHITNQRTMEVLRDLGVADEVARYGSHWQLMGDTLFTTSLAGPEIARIRTWGTSDDRYGDYIAASPSEMVDVPQPHLESVLLKNAAERGAGASFSTEYLSHSEDADGVTVHLRDRLSGREYEVRARYLIGADGARSRVAEHIGLPVEGQMARASTAYVQFSADLSRYVAHRPSILYWILSPSAAFGEIGMGLLRAVRPWDQWIAGWGYDQEAGDPDFSVDGVVARVRALVGDPHLELRIDATSTWQVNQAYATEYSKGRVFCAGDAVHRHPPSGGLGSNTSVQDAYNLAWKLAFVIRGEASPALLQTYSDERAPVGKQVVLRANRSRAEFGPFREAVSPGASGDPATTMVERMRDPSPEGVQRRDDLAAALELKNFEFNAHGVELNQRYVSAAILADGEEDPWTRDPELYAQPSTRPGAKLPHAWLVDERGHRISTLDRIGKGRFTVLTGLGGRVWVDALADLEHPGLRGIVVGDVGQQDLYGTWRKVSGIPETAALLVRPDGYIAWRSAEAVPERGEASSVLREALRRVMGHNERSPRAL